MSKITICKRFNFRNVVVGLSVIDLTELISYNYTVSLCMSTLGAMSP